ncbi:MAG: hypothetical protein EOM18_04285 [Clostridia bacterium]|nr:hypothetical protein [Clostridia bacterium]
MNDKSKLRLKYWALLLNPVFVMLYMIGWRYLYLLCQFGGTRRRLPVIGICGVVGLAWLITWTVLYFVKKHKDTLRIPAGKKIYVILLCIELAAILASTAYYGSKLIDSAQNYNGALSWKIDEIKRSREITLTHGNIYKDGVKGIFDDLKEEVELPSELYLANEFSLDFDADGTITEIYSFFYGKTEDGEESTYLLDYNKSKSDKMTVWLDGYADAEYKDEDKLAPMFELLDMVNIQSQVQLWQETYGGGHFGILYEGYRSFDSAEGIIAVNDDGSILPYNIAAGSSETYGQGDMDEVEQAPAGYEVSLYVPGDESITPVRYLNMWEKIEIADAGDEGIGAAAEENGEQNGEQNNNPYEPGISTTDPADGTVYYFLDENQGWRLVVTDAAAGSRFYVLESTGDGGVTWSDRNGDPFSGDIGTAEGITFFDENFGFIGMGTATAEYSDLYVTYDGGITFSIVELPMEGITDMENVEEYDYADLPYMEGSVVYIVLKTESAGQDKLLFESEDKGANWSYAGYEGPEGIEDK